MAFQSFIDPIETLISRYFEKKRTLSENEPGSSGELFENGNGSEDKPLPESPCKLLRDDKKRVHKCIYGDYEELVVDEDSNLIIWQEELIRDEKGTTIAVETTYPDGSMSRENIVREGGVVTGVK